MLKQLIKKQKKLLLAGLVLVLVIVALGMLPGRNVSSMEADTAGGDTTQGETTQGDASSYVATARPSVNGQLHVEDGALRDAEGNVVQLRGVSTHGLTWYPEYVNEGLIRQVSEDWNCNMIRFALYSEFYCGGEKEENLELIREGIDSALAADMYVLVDWHILNDADPNENMEGALEFFDWVTARYGDSPNLIYEICNEPNGSTDWADVRTYCDRVIPFVRERVPESVILVGTPEYDRNLGDCILRPLDYDNVMYVLHFYTATHHEGLREELQCAVDAGLPVFISECGICEASGDGSIDFASAVEWFTYVNEQKLSYAVWSLSDKDESSAFFKTGFDPYGPIGEEDLSTSGKWVRSLIRGEDPARIPAPAPIVAKSRWAAVRTWIRNSLVPRGSKNIADWGRFAIISCGLMLLALIVILSYVSGRRRKRCTYDDIVRTKKAPEHWFKVFFARFCLVLSTFLMLIYMCWRVVYSVPVEYGVLAVTANILLLIVEILGFVESLVLYRNLLGYREHPLPEIPEDAWPEVDIFIATYNEPTELLRKTINGCIHLRYPDKSKVHIWVCDDNRRPTMRALAKEMGVGYFDRPNNEGAKAGNLNHALGLTHAPYVVTLDADMIVKSDFLLKTIPYFVDVELREAHRPEEERLHLGLLQTPQCFYDPDVFQHALYSEKRAPNEQDFFYRTIEPAKTCTNSVIYGGSNTVLSRKALEQIGGFYTGSITEDFATGMLIEDAGYVSLALPEPLASGQTPHTFKEHIKQRTRWGRGVIVTARKLKYWRRKDLSLSQKISYWSSVVYWYSPIKNLFYLCAPLLYAVVAIPVFACNWLELVVYWLPMFLMQDLSLRLNSNNAISIKWSGIYETSVMPHLLIPILKESMGITLSKFKVTDKSGRRGKRVRDMRSMMPFLILTGLSVVGIIRVIVIFTPMQTISLMVILFWLVRNLYYLIMALFLVDGRDSDEEPVKVLDAEPVVVKTEEASFDGVTTLLTEHSLVVFLDSASQDIAHPGLGTPVEVTVHGLGGEVGLKGVVTGINLSKNSTAKTYTIEILEFISAETEYWQVLYDRVPTLPQSLQKDLGTISHLWQNIAHRVARTRK